MLEDLQVNIIGVLERRVEQAVELINQMKSESQKFENFCATEHFILPGPMMKNKNPLI